MLKLSRPLAFLDIESTGLDVQKDRIITIAIEVHSPESEPHAQEWKFDPGIPIPPEVSEVHGMTDAMVKDWPAFETKAKFIHGVLEPCDFGGYNTTFDLSILSEELSRCGFVLDTSLKSILDVGMIYKKKCPRRLEDAVKHYCHRDHVGAHGALADTVATREVFESQMEQYENLAEQGFEAVARYSMCDERDGSMALDLANTLRVRKDGVVVYGTKRNRGVPVADDVGYAQWILRTDFPANTHQTVRKVLDQIEKNYRLSS